MPAGEEPVEELGEAEDAAVADVLVDHVSADIYKHSVLGAAYIVEVAAIDDNRKFL